MGQTGAYATDDLHGILSPNAVSVVKHWTQTKVHAAVLDRHEHFLTLNTQAMARDDERHHTPLWIAER